MPFLLGGLVLPYEISHSHNTNHSTPYRLKSLKIEFMFEAAQVELLDLLIRKAGVRLEKIELGVIGFPTN